MSGFLHLNDRPGMYPASYYAATASALPLQPALSGAVRADVAIIGGGYAGLSAALHLAQRGYRVHLCEAHRLGWGASGRNGGQLGTTPRREAAWLEATVGLADAKRIYAVALAANRLVRDLIASHGIACDLRDGIIYAHHRARFDKGIEAEIERLATVFGHHGLEWLPPAAMRAAVATTDYSGGVRDRLAAHLHPLNFALGLARAALGAGAVLHEHSQITRIDHGAKITLHSAQGRLTADHLIVAVNGYHDGLVPQLACRVMPINNFIVATAPLGSLADRLIPGREAVADTRFVINYYRLSADGRMLFGGGESSGKRFPPVRELVIPRLLRVFPQLAGVPIDYAWGGTLAITANRNPAFLRLAPNALAIGGWSGHGIHMATMGGKIAAETIAGQAERFDLMARVPIPSFPGGQMLRTPLLRLALWWFGLRDWL